MSQTISAEKITLYDLENRFGLQRIEDANFFQEWYQSLPEISELEKEQLDRVKANYLHLSTPPLLGEMVKMVIVSPLLDLAGFYQPPFFSVGEKSVKLAVKDESITIRGKLDVLVLQDQFWVLVIESKQAGLSLQPGIPQALAYMLGSPHPDQPLYGMVTNGSNFIFLKLVQQKTRQYAFSNEFTLMKQENELPLVLQILKRLAGVIKLKSV